MKIPSPLARVRASKRAFSAFVFFLLILFLLSLSLPPSHRDTTRIASHPHPPSDDDGVGGSRSAMLREGGLAADQSLAWRGCRAQPIRARRSPPPPVAATCGRERERERERKRDRGCARGESRQSRACYPWTRVADAACRTNIYIHIYTVLCRWKWIVTRAARDFPVIICYYLREVCSSLLFFFLSLSLVLRSPPS